MREHIRSLQAALRALGHDPGPVDGFDGPRTRAAALAFGQRGAVVAAPVPAPVVAAPEPPWLVEARRILGRHETRDNGWLSKWLRSDGRTLGDPAKLPWCGDFVETCIRLTLPDEPFPGALGENPYWARNWNLFGAPLLQPALGAVVVFSRGSGGHVGFAVGEDSYALHVLGGNQSNAVTIARISKDRLIGMRWPSTFARPASRTLPRMTAAGKLSTNEA